MLKGMEIEEKGVQTEKRETETSIIMRHVQLMKPHLFSNHANIKITQHSIKSHHRFNHGFMKYYK